MQDTTEDVKCNHGNFMKNPHNNMLVRVGCVTINNVEEPYVLHPDGKLDIGEYFYIERNYCSIVDNPKRLAELIISNNYPKELKDICRGYLENLESKSSKELHTFYDCFLTCTSDQCIKNLNNTECLRKVDSELWDHNDNIIDPYELATLINSEEKVWFLV